MTLGAEGSTEQLLKRESLKAVVRTEDFGDVLWCGDERGVTRGDEGCVRQEWLQATRNEQSHIKRLNKTSVTQQDPF